MSFESLQTAVFGPQHDLKKIAAEHPYFSAAHFFLLQQTAPSAEGYAAIAAKTSLHFANPYLLKQQLSKTDEAPLSTPALVEPEVPEVNSYDQRVEVMEEPVNDPLPTESTGIVTAYVKPEVIAETVKEDANTPLIFEPLHTTDYFASQGIKLSEVVLPGDKMGRQLKSFTEWLKTMKKVHPDDLKGKPAQGGFIDPSVQKLAEKSNEEEAILTESMAEVYLQQGKTNKAKEIYEKLSLLNPSKNAYFAAKLNEIQ